MVIATVGFYDAPRDLFWVEVFKLIGCNKNINILNKGITIGSREWETRDARTLGTHLISAQNVEAAPFFMPNGWYFCWPYNERFCVSHIQLVGVSL